MKELMLYVELIREIVRRCYEKEMLFYENGEWYSRRHGRYITHDELSEWMLSITILEEDYE